VMEDQLSRHIGDARAVDDCVKGSDTLYVALIGDRSQDQCIAEFLVIGLGCAKQCPFSSALEKVVWVNHET
jgi:hypothetical protein